jgi:hypothetical protein
MPRVVIEPVVPDRQALDNEIAHLRDLEIKGLRARPLSLPNIRFEHIDGVIRQESGARQLASGCRAVLWVAGRSCAGYPQAPKFAFFRRA